MSSNVLIGQFAQGVWENLGQPDCVSFLSISGFFVQPSSLGWLNSQIGTCYMPQTGAGGYIYDTSPPIGQEELSLLAQKYEVGYFKNLARANMGVGGNSIPWTRLREADESIDRANVVNIGTNYIELSRDAQKTLNYNIGVYIQTIQQGGTPRDVVFLSPAYYPRPYSTVVTSRE